MNNKFAPGYCQIFLIIVLVLIARTDFLMYNKHDYGFNRQYIIRSCKNAYSVRVIDHT